MAFKADTNVSISYVEAIDLILEHATQQRTQFVQECENISLANCLRRVCSEEYRSPISTPKFDTSAMDGYAVNSDMTRTASVATPLTFRVKGTMAAGQEPLLIQDDVEDEIPACIEIMTGAQFPETSSTLQFDACVRVEDTTSLRHPCKLGNYIQIYKPVLPNQNRRPAGNDFREKELIMAAGTTIRPEHVMGLASLGVDKVNVYRPIRVGIISTGSELLSTSRSDEKDHIYDSNRPYISAVLTEMGIDVVDLGIVKDDGVEFAKYLAQQLTFLSIDVIITTGAVSKGKFDFVRDGIESLGAQILFHKVKVRPGHPILFAEIPLPSKAKTTTFFGLPGNPMAAAACLRFFVVPYIAAMNGQELEPSRAAQLKISNATTQHLHVFLHGKVHHSAHGAIAEPSLDQGSSKIRPFMSANCWISVPPGAAEGGTKIVQTFPTI